MSEYVAPMRDIKFVLQEVAGLEEISKLPGCEDATMDTAEAILEEAGKFASEVLSPLNRVGDTDGARWNNGEVTTSPGWKDAYNQFVEGGWNAFSCEPEYGGQGLPKLLATAVMEMWKSANMAFALCPMLTAGAIEALMVSGNDEQKNKFLPKMVSGEWTGTMNLTEPNAGSDLAAVRTRAEPQPDGTYKIFGQKIFITYGEHDLTDNIIHLVLARLPEAPEGVKGISLFVVPKFLLNEDGTPGKRNDVHCVSIEHKLGIHGSPTAVLAFGDNGGAVGELLGELNRGLEYMFIMMNEARFAVGMEGLGISERAYQKAAEYARERIQGAEPGVRGGPKVPIIRFPDVRRMLLSIRAHTEAMRALAYTVAAATDRAHCSPDEKVRAENQAFVELMTPVVKGWLTETGIELASTGVQVHGGMGFIEETGAAQYLRDARITAIYEGTTGIQANDLIGRKTARDGGETVKAVLAQMRQTLQEVAACKEPHFVRIHKMLEEGINALEAAMAYIVATFKPDIKAASAGAVPYLKLFGIVAGGWLMARASVIAQKKLAAGEGDAAFYKAKIATTRFYADHILAMAPALSRVVTEGAEGVMALEEDSF